MRTVLLLCRAALVVAGLLGSSLAGAADFPPPKEADWTEDVSYDSAIDEQLALLARKAKATDRLRVAGDGSIVIDKRRGRDKV